MNRSKQLKYQDLAQLCSQIIEVYCGTDSWKQKTTKSTVSEMQLDSLLTVLCLEGIGNMAELLGSHFQDLLVDSLYPILEKLGHNDSNISKSAFITLERISKICDTQSVELLVENHLDHLIDTIVHHLQYLSEYPQTPHLLLGILRYSKASILHLLEDTLEAVFSGFESNPSQRFSFLMILNSLLSVWKEKVKTTDDPEEKKKLCQEMHPFALQILEKSQHFLAIQVLNLKILVMEIICDGLYILSISDSSGILPTIHTLWNPLLLRFQEKNLYIQIHALSVVNAMCAYSNDFLTTKFSQDLWPVIKGALKELAALVSGPKPTKKANCFVVSTNYSITQSLPVSSALSVFTPSIKLLLAYLENLKVSTIHIPLTVQLSQEIAFFTQPFFHVSFPKEIHTALENLWIELIRLDEDGIWLFLHKLLSSSFQAPSIDFESTQLISDFPASYFLNVPLIRSLLIKTQG